MKKEINQINNLQKIIEIKFKDIKYNTLIHTNRKQAIKDLKEIFKIKKQIKKITEK